MIDAGSMKRPGRCLAAESRGRAGDMYNVLRGNLGRACWYKVEAAKVVGDCEIRDQNLDDEVKEWSDGLNMPRRCNAYQIEPSGSPGLGFTDLLPFTGLCLVLQWYMLMRQSAELGDFLVLLREG